MIYRRYGSTWHSVEADFDSNAMNEINFRRDRTASIPAEEIESSWERVSEHELVERKEGDVQGEVEQELLDDLLEQLGEITGDLAEDEIVLVENEQGRDWPKTRQEQKNVIREGQNRLYFHIRVEPPLRVGVYRKSG